MKDYDKYRTRGAYHYDWYKTEDWYKRCVDKCVEFCKGSTLDVGCGEGLVVDLLERKGIEAVGVDQEQSAVDLADPELDVRQGNFEEDIFLGKWDYMVCLNVIEHLEKPDAVVRLFDKNITKAGIIITDVPQEHPSSYHTHEYTSKELMALFPEYQVVPFQIDKDFHGIKVYK